MGLGRFTGVSGLNGPEIRCMQLPKSTGVVDLEGFQEDPHMISK
jgi:hypothetical protein